MRTEDKGVFIIDSYVGTQKYSCFILSGEQTLDLKWNA